MPKPLSPAIVQAALKAKSQKEQIPIGHLRDRYAFTGFLRRLMVSKHKDVFTLKGSMIMIALTGRSVRPTKDIDLSSEKKLTEEQIKQFILDVITTKLPPGLEDGLTFDVKSIIPPTEQDRNNRAGGDNYRFKAVLGSTRIDMSLDFGFGHPRVPHDLPATIPPLLPHKGEVEVNLMRYPVETTLAEKMRAAIYHGAANTRMKDFFDINEYANMLSFDGAVLTEALVKTCDHFGTEIPPFDDLTILHPDMAAEYQGRWVAFLNKAELEKSEFPVCAARIREFMKPVVEHARDEGPEPGTWQPEHGWQLAPAPTVV
jgi:hypothetical protein